MLSDETSTHPSPSGSASDYFNKLLPYEIKQEIFTMANYQTSMKSNNDMGCEEEYEGVKPYILLTVCKEWRDIIITTPTLWTFFKFYVERSCSYMPMHTLFHMYKKMSKGLPMCISVRLSFVFYSENDGGNLLAMLHQMKHVANRLIYLRIHFLDTDMHPTLLKAIQDVMRCDLPMLKTARLWWIQTHSFRMTAENSSIMEFGDCPNLGQLALPVSYTPGTVGYSNIAELSIRSVPLSAFLLALEHSPNLRNVQGDFLYDDGSSQSPMEHEVVLNPALTQLRIALASPTTISKLLKRMRCPALLSLKIKAAGYNSEVEVGGAIEQFLKVSRCPLRTLTIKNAIVADESLTSILDYVQSTITYLHLCGCVLHLNHRFPTLVQKLESYSYLPQLRVLYFDPRQGVPVDFSSILRMLQARQQIEIFVMELKGNDYEIDKDVELGFRELNEKGLRAIDIYFEEYPEISFRNGL